MLCVLYYQTATKPNRIELEKVKLHTISRQSNLYFTLLVSVIVIENLNANGDLNNHVRKSLRKSTYQCQIKAFRISYFMFVGWLTVFSQLLLDFAMLTCDNIEPQVE